MRNENGRMHMGMSIFFLARIRMNFIYIYI
jgi:hypothetical protein